jgi:hypothetical protein
MNLISKTMNGLNLMKSKPSNDQSPALIELPMPNANIANASQRAATVIERKFVNVQQKDTPPTLSFGRKKPQQAEAQVQQTPAEIISEVADKRIQDSNCCVQCHLVLQDESNNYLDTPISKQTTLNAEELEELLVFIEGVESRRKKQEKEQQERRSWAIAKQICAQPGGNEFLQEHSINCQNTEGSQEEWYQCITLVKPEGDSEEVQQALNFYNPQHSWILESWLSQQAVSWTVRRYSPNAEQIIYQVSFGFPDQTFLEAEGPSREGAILAVAEDLLED